MSGYDLRTRFSLRLTSPSGRKYITGVVNRGDSSVVTGICHAAEKGNSYPSKASVPAVIPQKKKTKWWWPFTFLLLFVMTAPLFARPAEFAFPQDEAGQGQVDDGSEEIRNFIHQLSITDPTTREKALYGLCICRKRAIPYLYEALKDTNPMVRSGVLEAFSRMYVEDVWPKLLEFFKKEKDPKVKTAYIDCLAKFGVQESAVVEEFIRMLRKEKNERVSAELITGLRRAAGEKKAGLTPLPEDYSEMLQTMARTAFLEKLRDPDTTEFVKLYLVKALGELREIRALSILASLLLDPMEMGTGSLHLQLTATQALKTIGTPEARQILINCLDRSRQEVKEAAVPLLSSFGAQVLDDLIGVVNNRSKSSFARGGAVDAIGRMTDFGKPLQKEGNIEKVYKTLEAAKIDPDRYVADKASEAIDRLKGNGVKRNVIYVDAQGLVREDFPSEYAFRARLSHFSVSLTSPSGRKYITSVVNRGDLSVGTGIRGVPGKANSY